jgi:hypothetical protein
MEHGNSNVFCMQSYETYLTNIRSLICGKAGHKHDWMLFVIWYSQTKFTDMKDRLVALSSLARAVHPHFGYNNIYYAGIWGYQLIEGLLWFRKFPPRLKSGQRLDIAPTWSWASLNREISYPYFYDGYGPLPPVSVLLDVYSVPAQFNNPYGNLKEGRVELLAQILTVSLPTMFTFCLDIEVVSRNGHETMRRSVYWDEVDGAVRG